MKFSIKHIAIFVLFTLVGCATHIQNPVAISDNFWDSKDQKIGVIMEDLPKINTFFPGAGCLLCLAAAEAAHSSLSKKVQTYSSKELLELKKQIADSLETKGFDVKVIDETIETAKLPKFRSDIVNTTRKDFTNLKGKYGIDQLLVIDINTLGVVRNFSSYIPTTDPQATFTAVGYMVNLEDNTLNWYKAVNLYRSAEGEWDEAPEYPGLTNAYYQVVEQGQDSLKEPFAIN